MVRVHSGVHIDYPERMFPPQALPACANWPMPATGTAHWEDLMWDWQDQRCAFCGNVSDRLNLDHDHVTGFVRGFLCTRCNTNEPYEWAHSGWIAYRELCSPAEILGIRVLFTPSNQTAAQRYIESIERASDPRWQISHEWSLL